MSYSNQNIDPVALAQEIQKKISYSTDPAKKKSLQSLLNELLAYARKNSLNNHNSFKINEIYTKQSEITGGSKSKKSHKKQSKKTKKTRKSKSHRK
jgi:hypothetical protein